MQPEKPHLFIGSSQESREKRIVDHFTKSLESDALCIPWWLAPQFSNSGSSTTFAALCEAANSYDFALFILTPDDLLESRQVKSSCPRDNVTFEFGLFIGAIGPDRVFASQQKTAGNFKAISDLAGVNMPRFEYDAGSVEKTIATINAACGGFTARIREAGHRKIDLSLADEWWFDEAARVFRVTFSAAKITRNRSTVGKWRLCVAARIHDDSIDFEEDPHVVYSALRNLPGHVEESFPIIVNENQFYRPVQPKEKVQGRIMLVPDGLAFDNTKTFNTALRARCREIERVSFRLGGASPGA